MPLKSKGKVLQHAGILGNLLGADVGNPYPFDFLNTLKHLAAKGEKKNKKHFILQLYSSQERANLNESCLRLFAYD